MTPDTVRHIIGDFPGPFRVHLADGRNFVVRQADHFILMKGHLIFAIDPEDGGIPEISRHINLRQIVEIETLATDHGEAA